MKPSHDEQTQLMMHRLNDLDRDMSSRVTREEFETVRRTIYAVIAMVILAAFLALLCLLIPRYWWNEIERLLR